jgi:exosortase/archaeosortase family protein
MFGKLKLLISSIYSNKLIVSFFVRLLILTILTMVIYSFLLKPIRMPDRILTEAISKGTVLGINKLFPVRVTAEQNPVIPQAMDIKRRDVVIIRIFDDCNGLDLIAIYIGLIVLLPYKISRKLLFIASGIVVLVLANIVRCIALYWVLINYRYLFDINHHFVFTILIYLLIFYGWLLFTKKGRLNEIK